MIVGAIIDIFLNFQDAFFTEVFELLSLLQNIYGIEIITGLLKKVIVFSRIVTCEK